MALRETLTMMSVTAAAAGGLAELPTSVEAQTHQPGAEVQAYQAAPQPTFKQFLESQAGAMAVTADAAPVETQTVTMVTNGLSENASQVASKTVIVGENNSVKIDKKTATQCIETKPGQPWTNSVKLANGSTYYYTETTPAKLCRDKYSPLGWVKRGGGETGLDCKNVAAPKVIPAAHKNVEVVNVRHLDTSFTLVAKVALDRSVVCPGVEGDGSVYGEIKQKFNLKSYLRMNGAAQEKFDFKLVDKASVKAHLDLNCSSNTTTTTTTTPNTPPQPPVTPPTHGCEVSTITQKDGRDVNLTVVTDGGNDAPTSEAVDWGDGQSSSYSGTAPSQVETHFYNSDGTFTDTVTLTFADGGSASCTGQSVTLEGQGVPQPPTY